MASRERSRREHGSVVRRPAGCGTKERGSPVFRTPVRIRRRWVASCGKLVGSCPRNRPTGYASTQMSVSTNSRHSQGRCCISKGAALVRAWKASADIYPASAGFGFNGAALVRARKDAGKVAYWLGHEGLQRSRARESAEGHAGLVATAVLFALQRSRARESAEGVGIEDEVQAPIRRLQRSRARESAEGILADRFKAEHLASTEPRS